MDVLNAIPWEDVQTSPSGTSVYMREIRNDGELLKTFPIRALAASILTSPISPQAVSAQVSPKPESPLVKFMIGAGVTWGLELFIGHYLEFLKIARQTSQQGYVEITRSVTRHKGVIGVWDGFFPWGSIQAVTKGAVFSGGHALSKRYMHGHMDDRVSEVLSGGLGGGVQGLALSPILLLKTRVITDQKFRNSGGLFKTALLACHVSAEVIKKEGMKGLMKGSILFSTKRVADWTSRFFFVVLIEQAWIQSKLRGSKPDGSDFPRLSDQWNPSSGDKVVLSPRIPTLQLWERSMASILGGAFSALITIPLDVLVAQFQQANSAGKNLSAIHMMRDQVSRGGWRQLVDFSTRGFCARLLHVSLTTWMMKTVTSVIYDTYVRT